MHSFEPPPTPTPSPPPRASLGGELIFDLLEAVCQQEPEVSWRKTPSLTLHVFSPHPLLQEEAAAIAPTDSGLARVHRGLRPFKLRSDLKRVDLTGFLAALPPGGATEVSAAPALSSSPPLFFFFLQLPPLPFISLLSPIILPLHLTFICVLFGPHPRLVSSPSDRPVKQLQRQEEKKTLPLVY